MGGVELTACQFMEAALSLRGALHVLGPKSTTGWPRCSRPPRGPLGLGRHLFAQRISARSTRLQGRVPVQPADRLRRTRRGRGQPVASVAAIADRRPNLEHVIVVDDADERTSPEENRMTRARTPGWRATVHRSDKILAGRPGRLRRHRSPDLGTFIYTAADGPLQGLHVQPQPHRPSHARSASAAATQADDVVWSPLPMDPLRRADHGVVGTLLLGPRRDTAFLGAQSRPR